MLLTSTSEVAAAVLCLVISTHMCEQHMPVRGVIKGSLTSHCYSALSTQQKHCQQLCNSTRYLCAAAAAKQLYNRRPPRQFCMRSLALPVSRSCCIRCVHCVHCVWWKPHLRLLYLDLNVKTKTAFLYQDLKPSLLSISRPRLYAVLFNIRWSYREHSKAHLVCCCQKENTAVQLHYSWCAHATATLWLANSGLLLH